VTQKYPEADARKERDRKNILKQQMGERERERLRKYFYRPEKGESTFIGPRKEKVQERQIEKVRERKIYWQSIPLKNLEK
jgi:hypothetical protein